MKPGLKRIEATLDQMGVQEGSTVGVAEEGYSGFNNGDARSWHEEDITAQSTIKARFHVEPFPLPKGKFDATPVAPTASHSSHKEHLEAKLPVLPTDSTVESVVPPSSHAQPNPEVPASQLSSLGVNRPAANPNLVIGLLKEIETLVKGWQKELEQTVQQIQVVYQDGPIVDGWLESYPPGGQAAPPSASVSMLRHAEIEHLMAFIEQICEAEQAQITEDMRRTSYRLCGLDPDGKMWSRPCPSEQVPYVSLAIARYQKLRTLLSKKQNLDHRLTRLVESLTMLHGQINE